MAAAGRKLGDAYIAVTADARGLGTDLSKKASAALDKAARQMGATLDEGLEEAVERSTDGLQDKLGEPLEESAKRAGGRFQDTLRKSLTRAVSDLPDIPIGVDSSEADRTINSVRSRLEQLSGQTIGIDVDAMTALAELDIIEAELAQLAASSVDVQVRTDTAAARAALAAVQKQVRELDGKDIKLDIDGAGAAGAAAALQATAAAGRVTGNVAGIAGIAMKALVPVIIGVVLALGAILPAAVAGLGGLSALAVGAAAGLAVLALGFSGVGDAMKLIERRETALATAVGGGGAAAGAAASATRSLQNARENAAESAVRAAERVSRAQEELGETYVDVSRRTASALRSVEDAQLGVIEAIEAARRQQEDLALDVVGNANAQRQAIIDVAEAQDELNKVMRNRRATDAMREGAQLAYDTALHRQAELRLQGQRLADEQAEFAEKGVEGSDDVVDAQQRLLDAERDLAEARQQGARSVLAAQRAVTDALREQESQARQSAFSVASALAAVTAASAGAGGGGSAALAEINRELEKVNPATLAFATFLRDRVQPAIDRIKDTAAENMLPGVQKGIEALEPLLPRFESIVGTIATKLGDLFTQAGERLNSPFWLEFFEDLEANAGPILQDLSDIIWNITEGLAGIIQAFLGDADDLNSVSDEMGDGLVSITEDFAEWGKSLKDNPEFFEFIEDVKDAWPQIVDGAKEFGAALQGIFEFFEEHGDTIMSVVAAIGDVAEDLSNLVDPDAIQADFEEAWDTITGWGDSIAEWWDELWADVGEWGSNFAEGFNEGLDKIGEWFKEKWEGLVDWFKDFFGIHSPSTLFAQFGTWIIEGFLQGLQSLLGSVLGFWSGLPGRIGAALGALRTAVGDKATAAFTWFRDTATTKATELVTWLQGLPGRLAGSLGNLGTLLVQKGKDLMQGLVNGISSAAGFVGDVAKNIVNSVIGFVNKNVIDGINNLLEFKVAGVTINPPDIAKIPKLANGAIVDRPTLAVIGEAGREAVIPLSSGRAGRRAALMEEAGLAGGAGMTVDARQYYEVRDTQTAQEVGAVVGQRVVRDVRNGVSSSYTGVAA